ncbi:hypothetical protein FRB97_007808 [Tulasnella sp. 331]|nr:hypothetical protein FRB97_007808 [Tulasnella sp. 331]
MDVDSRGPSPGGASAAPVLGAPADADMAPSAVAGASKREEKAPVPRYKWTEPIKARVWGLVHLSNEMVRLAAQMAQWDKEFQNTITDHSKKKELYGKIVAAFPDGWMNTGVISREISAMKAKLKKESEVPTGVVGGGVASGGDPLSSETFSSPLQVSQLPPPGLQRALSAAARAATRSLPTAPSMQPPRLMKYPTPRSAPTWLALSLRRAPSTASPAPFIVLIPKARAGQSSGVVSAWVGIDGDTCGNAILQTGVDFTINQRCRVVRRLVAHMSPSRITASDCLPPRTTWYESLPAFEFDFTGIPIKAGDSIATTVNATSPTSGTAVIRNNTTGEMVLKALTSSSALCNQNVEWIVGGQLAGHVRELRDS